MSIKLRMTDLAARAHEKTRTNYATSREANRNSPDAVAALGVVGFGAARMATWTAAKLLSAPRKTLPPKFADPQNEVHADIAVRMGADICSKASSQTAPAAAPWHAYPSDGRGLTAPDISQFLPHADEPPLSDPEIKLAARSLSAACRAVGFRYNDLLGAAILLDDQPAKDFLRRGITRARFRSLESTPPSETVGSTLTLSPTLIDNPSLLARTAHHHDLSHATLVKQAIRASDRPALEALMRPDVIDAFACDTSPVRSDATHRTAHPSFLAAEASLVKEKAAWAAWDADRVAYVSQGHSYDHVVAGERSLGHTHVVEHLQCEWVKAMFRKAEGEHLPRDRCSPSLWDLPSPNLSGTTLPGSSPPRAASPLSPATADRDPGLAAGVRAHFGSRVKVDVGTALNSRSVAVDRAMTAEAPVPFDSGIWRALDCLKPGNAESPAINYDVLMRQARWMGELELHSQLSHPHVRARFHEVEQHMPAADRSPSLQRNPASQPVAPAGPYPGARTRTDVVTPNPRLRAASERFAPGSAPVHPTPLAPVAADWQFKAPDIDSHVYSNLFHEALDAYAAQATAYHMSRQDLLSFAQGMGDHATVRYLNLESVRHKFMRHDSHGREERSAQRKDRLRAWDAPRRAGR